MLMSAKRNLLGGRKCPACFSDVPLLARRCPHCGETMLKKRAGALVAAGTVLQNRYFVGNPAGDGSYLCLDALTNTQKRIALCRLTDGEAAFFARQEAISQLADCPFVALAEAVFAENGLGAAVFDAVGLDENVPLDAEQFSTLLHTLANALLVLHSLAEEDAPWGSAVFGPPSLSYLQQREDTFRLLLLPAVQHGEPSEDIKSFGKLLLPFCPRDADALRRVTLRMKNGDYISVLELMHDLNCL